MSMRFNAEQKKELEYKKSAIARYSKKLDRRDARKDKILQEQIARGEKISENEAAATAFTINSVAQTTKVASKMSPDEFYFTLLKQFKLKTIRDLPVAQSRDFRRAMCEYLEV